MEKLCKVAEFSDNVACLPPGTLDQQLLALTYRSAFIEQGQLTGTGTPAADRLLQSIQNNYVAFENIPGFRVIGTSRADWPSLIDTLARKPTSANHPVKHILLMAMLFEEWGEFTKTYQRISEVARDSPAPLETVHTNQPDPRCEEFARMVRSEKLSVSAAARQIGVSPTTGVRWAKISGIAYTPRTKTQDERVLDEARKQLTLGKPKITIREETGISINSLDRLISSELELGATWRAARRDIERSHQRAKFCELIEQNPGATVKVIRKIPGNSYLWLYHNDRDWLIQHLPSLWQLADGKLPDQQR